MRASIVCFLSGRDYDATGLPRPTLVCAHNDDDSDRKIDTVENEPPLFAAPLTLSFERSTRVLSCSVVCFRFAKWLYRFSSGSRLFVSTCTYPNKRIRRERGWRIFALLYAEITFVDS